MTARVSWQRTPEAASCFLVTLFTQHARLDSAVAPTQDHGQSQPLEHLGMSPRTASTSPDEQADTTPTAAATPAAVSKKRRIDWETIDEPELFEGFTVKFVTSKKRRKSGRARNQNEPTLMDVADMRGYKKGSLSADIFQANPFPEAPLSAARYTVEPAHIWESTQRYRRFTSKQPMGVFETCFDHLMQSVQPHSKLGNAFSSKRPPKSKIRRPPFNTGSGEF